MFARKHNSEKHMGAKAESRALRGKHARRSGAMMGSKSVATFTPVASSVAVSRTTSAPAASAAPAQEQLLPAVNAIGQQDLERKFNEFFRMGAVVAVGELFDEGLLGWPTCVAEDVRAFLGSFGIKSLDDVRKLGLTGPYLEDFERVFATESNCETAA